MIQLKHQSILSIPSLTVMNNKDKASALLESYKRTIEIQKETIGLVQESRDSWEDFSKRCFKVILSMGIAIVMLTFLIVYILATHYA